MERLKEIGARLQKSGHIVVEGPAAELQTEPSFRELTSLPQNFYGNSLWDATPDQRVCVKSCLDVQSTPYASRAWLILRSMGLCLPCKHAPAVHMSLCASYKILRSDFRVGKQQRD